MPGWALAGLRASLPAGVPRRAQQLQAQADCTTGAAMVASARLAALQNHLRGAGRNDDAALRPSPTVVHPAPKATLRPKRVHTEADDVHGADRPGLTAEEIAFFKENGWLAKRRLLDPAAVSVVRCPCRDTPHPDPATHPFPHY